jgi:glycine betaine catabolism A
MTACNAIRQLLRERQSGYGLARQFYTDRAVYELELDALFYRQWLVAAHTCELAAAGSFLTTQIGAYPILIVRGTDGVLRAFHNTCRHRGSRLCSAARGTAPRIVCPYHQWTYGLDGRLFAARQMGAEVDRKRLGLKPVHCQSVAGYVFVCLATPAPDFDALRVRLETYLGPHRLEQAKVAFESTITEKANWKLVWENNRECYHCGANHPQLCRTFPEAPAITGVHGALDNPAIIEHWSRCEAAGLPSSLWLSANGQSRLARMPLLGEAVSYTLSGEPAVARALSDALAARNIGTLLLFHYPTSWNHVLADHAVSFRVTPLGPGETQLTTKWLVHRDAVEGRDYRVQDLTEVWIATNDQDRRIVEENQLGVASPAYEPGPYARLQEDGVLQFIDWYAGALEQHLRAAPQSLIHVA